LIIAIQEINVIWTKRSRGGSAAQRRNAVPEALALAIPTLPAEMPFALVREQFIFNEAKDFTQQHFPADVEAFPAKKQLKMGCVEIILRDGRLDAIYTYTTYCAGAPRRDLHPRTALQLEAGQWGQLMYNGRFSFEEDWNYRKTVLNIAYGEMFNSDIFFTPPKHVFKDLANLW
jgi:hypothetical protein